MKTLYPLLLALLVAACSDDPGTRPDETSETGVAVTVAAPQLRDVDYVLKALGNVESLQTPTLAAETAGQVLEINTSEGSAVEAGQILARIDDTLHRINAAKAAADLKRQEALTENQAREVDRLKRLLKTRAVTENQLEDQQAQLAAMQGLQEMARKQLEQARYLESKTKVMAPLKGIIARRYISIGDYVNVGQPLFDIVAVDTLQARFAFPEHNAPGIKTGMKVSLYSPANPSEEAQGLITAINPRIDAASRALEVIVEFENPGGWRPGNSVDITLLVDTHPEATTVPRLSGVNRNGIDVVYVAEKSRAVARPIELGWQDAEWVEILAGLTVDDTVIVEGAALVTEGTRISIKATN